MSCTVRQRRSYGERLSLRKRHGQRGEVGYSSRHLASSHDALVARHTYDTISRHGGWTVRTVPVVRWLAVPGRIQLLGRFGLVFARLAKELLL